MKMNRLVAVGWIWLSRTFACGGLVLAQPVCKYDDWVRPVYGTQATSQPRHNQLFMNSKGQALVEFAITIPLLALILAGTFQFGEMFLSKQKLQQAAKYGVWLVKEGEEDNEVRDKLINFLTEDKPKLNKKRISKIEIKDISISNFYPSSSKVVEIEYEFVPVKLLEKFVPVVKLRGRCVVTSDPWHYGFPGGWLNLNK